MTEVLQSHAIGAPMARIDGPAKVTGAASYAFEHRLDRPAYAHLVQATVARGWVTTIDVTAAQALDGVLFVLTHHNAPRLASDHDHELWVLQSSQVWYRGQVIGVVVADGAEIAREAASLVRVEYQAEPHEVRLRADDPEIYVRRAVVNSWASWRRRHWWGERASETVPDSPVSGDVAAEAARLR